MWSDVEYLLKIKIAFCSTRRAITHPVSLIKSQYPLKGEKLWGYFSHAFHKPLKY